MKKIFLGLLLISSAFIIGMEKEEIAEPQSIEQAIATEEAEIPNGVLMYLLRLADESDSPDDALQEIVKTVLSKAKKYAASNLPIEVILHMVDTVEFSTPIELLSFLFKLSSMNRHWRNAIEPKILEIACKKFKLPKKSTKKFIELVQDRSGVPLEYLQDLLVNRERQKKIKKLRELVNADLKQAIKNLEFAVYKKRRDEAMDIIMSLPKKIYNINFEDLLRFLIQQAEKDVLRMLIGAGININTPAINPTFIERVGQLKLKTHIQAFTALSYSIFFGYHDMVDFFLKLGVDVNIIDEEGFTALDFALEIKNQALEKLLKDSGAEEGPKIPGPWSFQPFTRGYQFSPSHFSIESDTAKLWFEIGQICNQYNRKSVDK